MKISPKHPKVGKREPTMNSSNLVHPKPQKKSAIVLPETLVTIDSESTRDIDDAVSVEQLQDGQYRVVVCIADPTNLVLPGSTEDGIARLLGATVYARETAIKKMLPAFISENKGSLVAGQARKAFVFEILIDQGLAVVSFRAHRSPITVSHRLSYEDIPQILQDAEHPCFSVVSAASTLANGLLAKRRGRGAMALYDLQRLIYMNEEGRLLQLDRKDQIVGHIVVQELMILANTQLARYLVQHDVPALFRNHMVKSAVPPSAELATTMEIWVKSGTADIEQAQELFSVMLGKATYGATVRGHYALAEPCYAHGTSPLRRYADLVNLRQLKCHLKAQPYIYDRAALESLGDELTVKAADRKEERSEGFKRAVQASAARALETGAVQRLADHELVQAIKIGAKGDALPEVLSNELSRRLANSLVTDKVTDTLFVALPAGIWTAEMRTAFADWVTLAPTRAVHLLMHGEQTGYLKDVTISAAGEGTAFVGQVQVTFNGETKEFRESGARKREAEQAASARAIHWLIGVELDESASQAPIKNPKQTVTGNPKGALMEFCQKHTLLPPAFTSRGQGPSHAMVFSCEAIVEFIGVTFTGHAKSAGSKKEAESIASADLLAQLKDRAPVITAPAPAPAASAIGGNAIGALQEEAQKMKWAPPAYSFATLSEVPPLFRATVVVAGPRAGRFNGEASTKQEAKTKAARAALGAK